MSTRFPAVRMRRLRKNLVPREHFVRRDVKRLPVGGQVAEQPGQPLREIGVVRDRPERVAVAGDDYRRAAAHSLRAPLSTVRIQSNSARKWARR